MKKKYIVSYDMVVSGYLEVEGDTPEEAAQALRGMDPTDLLSYVSTTEGSLLYDSVRVKDEVTP